MKFEVAEKVLKDDGKVVRVPMFEGTRLPVYATRRSAGADFYCAETVVIPATKCVEKTDNEGVSYLCPVTKPVMVHTGVKAKMEDDEALELMNRSGNVKRHLVLANGVGLVDADYYGNKDNDGEIMFAFYNMSGEDITVNKGDRIGQGVCRRFYHAEGAEIMDKEREGGFGHTGVI